MLRALPLCTCCRHYPGTATGVLQCSYTQLYQPSPKWQSGRPAQRPFRGLLGVHSHYGLYTRAVTIFVTRFTGGFNHFVASIVAPVASGWSGCRVGLSPTGITPPFHGARQQRTFGTEHFNYFNSRSYQKSSSSAEYSIVETEQALA